MKQNGLIKKVKRHPNGITEVPCSHGKLFVATVLDCCGGEIVGLAMDDNMRNELCMQAFESACKAQNAYGMIFHSDRGSQFTSYAFRESLAKYDAVQSMSGTGRGYDNVRMESLFATLKKEKLYRIRTERYSMSWVKTVIFLVCDGLLQQTKDLHLKSGWVAADGTSRETKAACRIALSARRNLLETLFRYAPRRFQKIYLGVCRLHFS
jgi:transposase InsO family protein